MSSISGDADEFAHFARIQKVLPEGSDFEGFFLFVCFFLVDKGRDNPNDTISGSTLARQRNAV